MQQRQEIRYADDADFEKAMTKVFKDHEELFKRLAD
jgi:hypothetical protein